MAQDVPGAEVHLAGPPCPEGFEYLWSLFLDVSSTRGSTGFGPAPISYAELDAYQRLMRVPLDAADVAVLRLLDAAFLTYAAERAAARRS